MILKAPKDNIFFVIYILKKYNLNVFASKNLVDFIFSQLNYHGAVICAYLFHWTVWLSQWSSPSSQSDNLIFHVCWKLQC